MFKGIIKLSIKTALSKAILGKSSIELPKEIKNKKPCINIKNDDLKCFYHSLLASQAEPLIKGNHKNEPKDYIKYKDLIKEPNDYQYPIKLEDIHLFEELNNMTINILELQEDMTIIPLRTTFEKRDKTVNLLLFHKDDISHYVWVKNISRLCNSKTTGDKNIYASYVYQALLKL